MKQHKSPLHTFSISLYLKVAHVCLWLPLKVRDGLSIGESHAFIQARSALYPGMTIRPDRVPPPARGNYHAGKSETL
jgi:hypothetical protein